MPAFRTAMDHLDFGGALDATWSLVRRANQYVEETAPWTLRREEDRERVQTVLYHLLESLRWISVLIWPIMPDAAARLREQLGCGTNMPMLTELTWGGLRSGQATIKGPALFPRLEESAAQ